MTRLVVVEDKIGRAVETGIEFVRQAKRGDRLAFGQLFDRYSRPVLSFLYGMVGQRELAEDLMQETFSRAFRLLPHLREEAKFSSWLFGIAKNVAREDYGRRGRYQNRVGLDDPAFDTLFDPLVSPELDAMQRQLYQAIRAGLAALDEERRTALALRVFADKSYQEIADIIGWSLAKVKIEIHRARLEMRKMIKPYV
jgi:RNA polymerase sigma-70 factor (ECF subfamily)